MQIRKNTKAFKTIASIIEACKDRPDRDQLIRLFITRAGQTVHQRIYIEGIQTDANLFYDLNYQAIVNNLHSAGYQLHVSDELPGIYFLRGSNKTWDETPFEFAEIIAKKFAGLPELPVTRKKEPIQKYALPTAKEISTSPTEKKKQSQKIKDKPTPAKRQPSFGITHEIEFTNLERVVYQQGNVSKLDVLTYYDKIADYLLPYLKDRVLSVRSQADLPTDCIELNADSWPGQSPIPNWIEQRTIAKGKQILLCNDKDHLLFYVERGCLEFSSMNPRLKSIALPDHLVIAIDASDIAKTIETTLAVAEVLKGLKLPSFVKTDGVAGFHIHIPLDAKCDFEKSCLAAEYICKLVRLKIPDLVTLNAAEELTYGKVSLQYHLNSVESRVVAPYSLVQGSMSTVAAPLFWKDVQPGLGIEDFTMETIFKKLKQSGDPFKDFFKKKVNAEMLLKQLHDHYSFLL